MENVLWLRKCKDNEYPQLFRRITRLRFAKRKKKQPKNTRVNTQNV